MQMHDRSLAEALLPLFAPVLASGAAAAAGPAALGVSFAAALSRGEAGLSPEELDETVLRQHVS